MDILILNDHYTRPSFSPRLRSLCDYLVEHGHTIEVFTERWEPLDFTHTYPIHEIPFFHLGYVTWAIKMVYSILTNWKDRFFAFRVLRQIKNTHFDWVMCTTASHFPLTAAYRIAKARGIKLYVDMREVAELAPERQYTNLWEKIFVKPWVLLSNRLDTRRRNKVLQFADLITTVSSKHQEVLQSINPHTQLIYNGFDPDDCYFAPTISDTFQITYIGRLIDDQDPSLLLKATHELNLPNLMVNFYSNRSVFDRLQQKGVQAFGFLPSSAIPDMIRRSSIIYIVQNPNSNGTSEWKFYNALGCERPVLCTPDTEGFLSQAIALTHAGLCSNSLTEVKDFILAQYDIWKRQGHTHQDIAHKELFNRQCQAQQIEDLLLHIARV